MKIYKIQSNCGGYKRPKGHLDTQLFPECQGTDADRDVVKKNRRKNEKKASREVVDKTPHEINECPFCGDVMKCRCPSWVHEQTGVATTYNLCSECKNAQNASIRTAKKKKEYKYNPYAVCNTTVDKEKDPEKYERCVKKVKDQQDKNKKQKKANSYNASEQENRKLCSCSLNGRNCK